MSGGSVHTTRTHSNILTAAVALLVAPVQAVVVAVALPQGPDAAVVVALELVAFAPVRLRAAAGGFTGGESGENQPETSCEICF